MTQKELQADARFQKKVSQLVMLVEKEKRDGKIDWHSRAHLAGDAHCVSVALDSHKKSGR